MIAKILAWLSQPIFSSTFVFREQNDWPPRGLIILFIILLVIIWKLGAFKSGKCEKCGFGDPDRGPACKCGDEEDDNGRSDQ